MGQSYLQEGDEVLITELEHHSNYVPWHFLRKSKNIKINFAEINEEGEITLEEIEKKITPKTKLISITHLSNVTGAILPVKEITQLAHSKGIIGSRWMSGSATFKIRYARFRLRFLCNFVSQNVWTYRFGSSLR